MAVTRKEKIRVMIYTLTYRIEGYLHIIPESRLTDMLNVKAKDFIPLTEVKFYDQRENIVLHEVRYTAVNRDAIIAVSPLEGEETFA